MRKASGGQRGVRKVRTAGGSRYYGLPIGSPITADDIARAKAKHGGAAPPSAERASAKTTKAVLDAPKPKEPNALQRFNRKIQTGRSKPSNAETEKARADELTNTGTKGGTVSVGEYVYDVPAGVSLHPSPTGGPNVYAVSQDESVRILTPSGIVDLDDDMSDQVLDRIYPGNTDDIGNDRASISTPDPDEANAEYDNAVAAHKSDPTDETAKAVTKAAKKVVDSTRSPKAVAQKKADAKSAEDKAYDDAKAAYAEDPSEENATAVREAAQALLDAAPKSGKPSPGSPGDDEPTSTPTSPKKQPTKAQQEWDRQADSDFGVEGERPDKGYGDEMSDSDMEFYSKPASPDDRRTPSQRKYDHAADSDYGIDGRQQRPDEGLGDQAEPGLSTTSSTRDPMHAKSVQPPADKGPADPSKPLGNGNWDVTSMGRSVAAPDPGEVASMQASPYTSKHLDENGNLTPERIAVHDAIIESFLEGLESQENPIQYMNGGGPASGKGTMTKGKNAELTNYPSSRRVNDEDPEGQFEEFTGGTPGALLIDPDAIKMQLPEVKEARARQATGDGTEDDKQWASSSHEESSQLAKRLHRAALERGYNVIYDGTGNGSANSVRSKVRGAKDLGYRVEANYLYLEPQEGIARAKTRADRANRIVPADQITGTYAKLPAIFDELKEEGLFDSVNLFDNNVAYGEPAVHIGTGDGTKFKILDTEAYQKYMSSRERTDFTRFEATAAKVRTEFEGMEPQVTALMESMAANHGVELAGLNHRLKEPDRLAAKLSEVAAKTGMKPEEVQNEIRDALRYTARVPDESYVDTIKAMLAEFQEQGYTTNAVNSWKPGSDYMGVNVEITDPETDKSFEVQFHTPESLRIKHDENHPIYKQARLLGKKGTAKRKPLDDQMAANSAKIPVPEGIFEADFNA